MGGYHIVERESSDDAPLGPGKAYFRYGGQVRQEDADITQEALYDEAGRLRATRDRWQIRRILEPDPYHIDRVLGRYPNAQQVRQRGVVGDALTMLATVLGIAAGAVLGGVIGALAFHASGLLVGCGVGGWYGGTRALAWARSII
jgi:hypothetical protein